MKLRKTSLAALALATGLGLSSGASIAQTAIVVDPANRADPNAPVVIVTSRDAVVVAPDNTLQWGQHYAIDRYGRRIVVDDAYDPAWQQSRSVFDSSVDRATGTVTSPGYMGPQDSTGQ